MIRSVCMLVTLGLVLVACKTMTEAPEAGAVEVSPRPSLMIVSESDFIPSNRYFPVVVSVEGIAPGSEVLVELVGVAGIEPDKAVVALTTDISGGASATLQATVTTPGHVSLVASADVLGETLSDSLDVVFDIQGVRWAAKSVGASANSGRVIEIEEYFANVPRTSDQNYVHWYETTSPVENGRW